MRSSSLLSALGFFVAGAILGYASLLAGPIPAVLAGVFLVLLLVRVNRRPEQPGSYLVGAGVAGCLTLGHVLLTCSAPSCHNDPSTVPALALFALAAIAGIWLVAQAIRKAR